MKAERKERKMRQRRAGRMSKEMGNGVGRMAPKTSPAAFDDDADSKTNTARVWVCVRLCVGSKTEN